MKRFLLLALTVVVACSLFVMTAFGAEYGEVIELPNLESYFTFETIPAGLYYLQIYSDGELIFTSTEFSFSAGVYYLGQYYNQPVTLELTVEPYYIERFGDGLFSKLILDEYYNFGDDVYYNLVRLNPTGDATSSPDFFADIGTFFTSAISWLGNVASFIVSRPVFLVVLAMPIIGFAVGLFSRIKAL